jgi:hypothetical protein
MKKVSLLPKAQNQAEIQLHAEIYTFFHNNYPEHRKLLNYNLNNSANAIDGNKNRQLGLQAGRSDFVLYYKKTAYMLELKTLTGKQREEQRKWQERIQNEGFPYIIIRTLEEFKTFIKSIGIE